jgi:hypothetical protein
MACYPDQTSTNVYRTTDPGGTTNYVITANTNNDWINPNDVDFQYPGWYAYITDVDGDGVELGDGNLDDDTVFFGGLLCDDPNGDWARMPLTTLSYDVSASPTHADVPSVICDNWSGANPWPNVAGYYSSTTGDTGAVERADYGTQAPHHTFDNTNPLAAEVVVHWDTANNFNPATNPNGIYPVLYWSMYPGHKMLVPGTSNEIPDDTGPNCWDAFLYCFDVDPAVAPAGRSGDIWNRSQFSFTDGISCGRTVVFDYKKVKRWNGDLNRDGVIDSADKFPVRCRLFTEFDDYADWAGTWPDHLQDPGSDPDGIGWQYDGDFIEAGAYAVDEGSPIYP